MSDHQTPSDEHYELFKAKVKINRLQSALEAALADNAAMLELAKHGCYGETQWDAYSMPVMFQCRCCNSRGKDWRLIDHAESCVMVHPHPGAALLERLQKAEGERDAANKRAEVSHGVVKDICGEWNESCDPECDSYGHTETCKAVNIASAKRALLEENKRLREVLDEIVKVSEADDSSAASDIKSILIHEGMMTND